MAGQDTFVLGEQTVGERKGGPGLASWERKEGIVSNERGEHRKIGAEISSENMELEQQNLSNV